MSIKENLLKIREQLSAGVQLVVVSKTYPVEAILQAYDCGERVFGENRYKEMAEKYNALPRDIQWHMIGSIQSKNVKYIAPFVSLIHSVDSEKLLAEIDKQALKNGRVIDVLMEVFVAREETKHGWNPDELFRFIETGAYCNYPNVRICGVMGMATFTDDQTVVRAEFRLLKQVFDRIRKTIPSATVLSMGMSEDFLIAQQEGSNTVRIGSAIFGKRI